MPTPPALRASAVARAACGQALRRALVVLVLGGPAPLRAQSVALFDAAVYIPLPVAITTVRPLSFGAVVAGIDATIAASDQTHGARLALTGAACASVDVRLFAPATLSGPSGATLAIDTFTGRWQRGDNTALWTPFTPSATATRLHFDVTGISCPTTSGSVWDEAVGSLLLEFGATVRPTGSQAPGVYTNAVTVDVRYVDWE